MPVDCANLHVYAVNDHISLKFRISMSQSALESGNLAEIFQKSSLKCGNLVEIFIEIWKSCIIFLEILKSYMKS